MKSLRDFEQFSIKENEMFTLNGGKKTEGGSYTYEGIEMCYSSDRTSWITGKTRRFDVAPCGCEC
jgi:hypothetical protein